MSRVRTGCWAWGLASAAAAVCTLPAFAQYVGRVDESKQQAGTHLRATAILEYTGDLTKIKESRLVPIVVWDGAQYQPGGLYLAQPAPLAVLSGTQYELESSGKPEGFFNIRDAEDLAGLWVGVGSFEAPAAPKPKAPPSARNHAYEVKDVDPDKPHFAHRPADEQQGGEGAGGGSASGAKSGPPIDPDRPTLHPRAGGDSGAGGAGSGSSGSGHPDDDTERPTFHRQSNASAEVPTSQPAVDPDRPRLEYKAPVDQAKLAKPDALFGIPGDMHQMAGVSDTRSGDTFSWTFSWANADDEKKMKTALEEIAEKAVAPPAAAAPSKPVGAAAVHRRTHQPPPAPLPELADEDFRTYSLSFGGGATMVLTARSTGTPVKYVTIVAEPDFYGQPKVLLKQVTSDDALDVSPRYRLVDAVDTAGDGRADLIFELRGQTYRQFAIYRIAGGIATEMFVTQPTAN
jgi:hypothetical protein